MKLMNLLRTKAVVPDKVGGGCHDDKTGYKAACHPEQQTGGQEGGQQTQAAQAPAAPQLPPHILSRKSPRKDIKWSPKKNGLGLWDLGDGKYVVVEEGANTRTRDDSKKTFSFDEKKFTSSYLKYTSERLQEPIKDAFEIYLNVQEDLAEGNIDEDEALALANEADDVAEENLREVFNEASAFLAEYLDEHDSGPGSVNGHYNSDALEEFQNEVDEYADYLTSKLREYSDIAFNRNYDEDAMADLEKSALALTDFGSHLYDKYRESVDSAYEEAKVGHIEDAEEAVAQIDEMIDIGADDSAVQSFVKEVNIKARDNGSFGRIMPADGGGWTYAFLDDDLDDDPLDEEEIEKALGNTVSSSFFAIEKMDIKRDKRGYRYCLENGRRVKCPPLADEGKVDKPKKIKMSTEEAAQKVRELVNSPDADSVKVSALAEMLTNMTVIDIGKLKKAIGIKASGRKAELISKVASRAVAQAASLKPSVDSPEEKPVEEETPVTDRQIPEEEVVPEEEQIPEEEITSEEVPTPENPLPEEEVPQEEDVPEEVVDAEQSVESGGAENSPLAQGQSSDQPQGPQQRTEQQTDQSQKQPPTPEGTFSDFVNKLEAGEASQDTIKDEVDKLADLPIEQLHSVLDNLGVEDQPKTAQGALRKIRNALKDKIGTKQSEVVASVNVPDNTAGQSSKLPSSQSSAKKQPWEMTFDDYAKNAGSGISEADHFDQVANAVANGEKVPDNVIDSIPGMREIADNRSLARGSKQPSGENTSQPSEQQQSGSGKIGKEPPKEVGRLLGKALEFADPLGDGIAQTGRLKRELENLYGTKMDVDLYKGLLKHLSEMGQIELKVVNEVNLINKDPEWKATAIKQGENTFGSVVLSRNFDPQKTGDAIKSYLGHSPETAQSNSESASKPPTSKDSPSKPALTRGFKSNAKVNVTGNKIKTASEWQKAFGKDSSLNEAASFVGAFDDVSVDVSRIASADKSILQFSVSIGEPGLPIDGSRIVTVDTETGDKVMVNSFLIVKKSERGKGLGTKLFSNQVASLIEAGFSKIKTSAIRSNDMNGYSTWPKMGYDIELSSDNLYPYRLSQIRDKFPDAKYLSDVMTTKEGRDWWDENGFSIDLEFDLKEGSRSRKILEAYLASKGDKASESNTQTNKSLPTVTPYFKAIEKHRKIRQLAYNS